MPSTVCTVGYVIAIAPDFERGHYYSRTIFTQGHNLTRESHCDHETHQRNSCAHRNLLQVLSYSQPFLSPVFRSFRRNDVLFSFPVLILCTTDRILNSPHVITHHGLRLHMYADDCQVYGTSVTRQLPSIVFLLALLTSTTGRRQGDYD